MAQPLRAMCTAMPRTLVYSYPATGVFKARPLDVNRVKGLSAIVPSECSILRIRELDSPQK